MSLTVRVITPDKTAWDSTAEEVILPSTTGQVGLLGGHAPLLTALDVGVMRVRPGKDWIRLAIGGGFAEVEADEVTVLVNSAERGDSIDPEEARAAYDQASERVKAAGDDREEQIAAERALKRSRARLQAATGKAP